MNELLDVASFLDSQFKTDYVAEKDLVALKDKLIIEGMEIIKRSTSSDEEQQHTDETLPK